MARGQKDLSAEPSRFFKALTCFRFALVASSVVTMGGTEPARRPDPAAPHHGTTMLNSESHYSHAASSNIKASSLLTRHVLIIMLVSLLSELGFE